MKDELATEIMALKVQMFSHIEELDKLHHERVAYRNREGNHLYEKEYLNIVEQLLLQGIAGFESDGKRRSDASIQRELAAVKAKDQGWGVAVAACRQADLGLEEIDAGIKTAQAKFQGTRSALEALSALCKMGRD